jgi:hypothetical protein
MTTPVLSPLRLIAVAAALILGSGPASGQETPLYRDPSPTESPRINGPLLAPAPSRPDVAPPPPGMLGPFQPPNRGLADVAPEIPRDPLLLVSPIEPPAPAVPMPLFAVDGDVKIRRKTTIQQPKGVLGRCHEWFHDILIGPPKSPAVATTDRGRSGWFSHEETPEGDIFQHPFKWPTWPFRETH